MKKLTKNHPSARWMIFFRAAPSSVAAFRLNHSASPVQKVSPMGLFLAQIVAIMLGFLFISMASFLEPFPCFSLPETTLVVLPEKTGKLH